MPSGVSPGIPAWAGWTHFFNLFLMMFIIRSGIQILCDHPRLYFSRNATPGKDEWLRAAKPVPDDPLWTAKDDSVALPRHWGSRAFATPLDWHGGGILGLTCCGCSTARVFYVLLFATGQWRHIGADQLGRFSQCRIGGDPIPVAELADRQHLGGLQRAAAAGVLHHRLHRRTARPDHRAGDVAGAVDAA